MSEMLSYQDHVLIELIAGSILESLDTGDAASFGHGGEMFELFAAVSKRDALNPVYRVSIDGVPLGEFSPNAQTAAVEIFRKFTKED
jgi:hypothetical protein